MGVLGMTSTPASISHPRSTAANLHGRHAQILSRQKKRARGGGEMEGGEEDRNPCAEELRSNPEKALVEKTHGTKVQQERREDRRARRSGTHGRRQEPRGRRRRKERMADG